MGHGLAQVGILAVLTVIVLPCCFFILLALLDRFERSLATDETTRAAEAKPVSVPEPVGAEIVALPVSVTVSPATRSAATG